MYIIYSLKVDHCIIVKRIMVIVQSLKFCIINKYRYSCHYCSSGAKLQLAHSFPLAVVSIQFVHRTQYLKHNNTHINANTCLLFVVEKKFCSKGLLGLLFQFWLYHSNIWIWETLRIPTERGILLCYLYGRVNK